MDTQVLTELWNNNYDTASYVVGVLIGIVGLFQLFVFLKFRTIIEKIPGPPTLPVLGNLWDARPLLNSQELMYHKGDSAKVKAEERAAADPLLQWIERYPKMFRIWLGPMFPLVAVTHPETLKIILGASGPNRKSRLYQLIEPWLGTGLLTSFGAKWKSRRRLITPTFHFTCLAGYFDVFERETLQLIEKFGAAADTGEAFHVYPLITHGTLDIIMECAFGSSLNAQRDSNLPYVKSVYQMLDYTFHRFLKPWQWLDKMYACTPAGWKYRRCMNILHSHTQSVIASRIKALKESSSTSEGPACFLDMLLQCKDEFGNHLSPADVQEEVDTFMFEGHDTTSAAITWCLYLLACHPDAQRKVHEELDQVLGGSPPTHASMTKLRYTTAAINTPTAAQQEALRLLPPVPFIARYLQEPISVGGFTVPAGIDLLTAPIAVHHNPAVWEHPWRYEPERFLSLRDTAMGARGDSWAFIPFSAGPRNCIGQQFAMLETRVVTAGLLQKFSLSAPPDQTVDFEVKIIMRPLNGKLLLKATRRHPAVPEPATCSD